MADLLTTPHDGHGPGDTCPTCPDHLDRAPRSRPAAGDHVTSPDQLGALDRYAVVLDRDGIAWQLASRPLSPAPWHSARGSVSHARLARVGPLRVLVSPAVPRRARRTP